jgi:hypothetical protein
MAEQSRTDQKVTGKPKREAEGGRDHRRPDGCVGPAYREERHANHCSHCSNDLPAVCRTRRSGSHYTPRSLTQPIVEAALAPVLKELGETPKPEQILALKVCDPAMGSGAFLVEACRQLGDALVPPGISTDERRRCRRTKTSCCTPAALVAQRCLYGVDKNEMAADLAKLSLWLATLARDHEFTFLDHALRHGDSLLGLSARQIAAFHWEPNVPESTRHQCWRGTRTDCS